VSREKVGYNLLLAWFVDKIRAEFLILVCQLQTHSGWRFLKVHIMAPLTALTGLSNSAFRKRWNTTTKQVLEQIKLMISSNVLLTYADPNVPFDIKPDASEYQLGAVIQRSNPLLLSVPNLLLLSAITPLSKKNSIQVSKPLKSIAPFSRAQRSESILTTRTLPSRTFNPNPFATGKLVSKNSALILSTNRARGKSMASTNLSSTSLF
jgi:hypothetical protein